MIADRSTTHVADTLALLTSAYKGRTAIEAIIRAFANRTQEVENALWQVQDAMQLFAPLKTRPTRIDNHPYAVGDEVSLVGEIGWFLRCSSVTYGVSLPTAPAGLTIGNAAYLPALGASVVDGGVTWTWFFSGNPSGVWLDAAGEIAGEPRLARRDPEYLLAVRAKLRVNRSFGRTIDIIDVMTLIGLAFQYNEYGDVPGLFDVDTYGNAYPATVARLIALAKPAGTRAVLAYTDLARAPVIVAGNVTAAPFVWNETNWADTIGGTDLTSWCSSQEAVST